MNYNVIMCNNYSSLHKNDCKKNTKNNLKK